MPSSHVSRRGPAERGLPDRVATAAILRRVLRKGLLVLVCAFASVASVAAAQGDRVFVDPGSPSGKEYALPIDRARQEAAARAKQRSGVQKAPLFGEGVNSGRAATAAPKKDTARTSDGGARSDSAERRSSRDTAALREKAADEAMDAAARAAAREATLARARTLRADAATPDGGIGLGTILAAGIGVLLVGGLIGLLLRHRATV